jgi:Copper transport outer membrane protein, MctB
VISLRYHIVSLVAVFLALALGIVVGSTVLREGTVSVLRATGEQVRQSNESYRQENLALQGEKARLQDFAATVLPDLVRGRLRNRPVVVLDTDRADGGVRDQVIQVLGTAGAEVDARVTFNAGRVALATEADRQALGRLLPGANAADPAVLRSELVNRVAERLGSSDPLPTEDPDRRNDLLTSLDDGGFLADLKLGPSVAGGIEPFPRPGSVVVVLGPTDGVALPPEAFLIPLADKVALAAGPVAGVEAAAAGTTPGTTSWIQRLRQDRQVTRRVSGIDDVDTAYGQLALVGALERRLQNLASGQYGFKQGNSGLLPEKVPGS